MKKRLNTLDKVLIILASFLFAFITTSIVIYTYKGWQYDTLITCVLGAGGVESIAGAAIQITKYFKGGGNDDTGNDNEND